MVFNTTLIGALQPAPLIAGVESNIPFLYKTTDEAALRLFKTFKHEMNYGKFIRSEIKDRTSQKGLHKAIWNFFMFPMTLIMNFIFYRKWIKLLDRLGLDVTELQEQVQTNVKEDKVSFRDALKKYGETQPSLRMNECYLVEKDELFIFPYHKPKTKDHFFTEIQEPIIISLSKSKHPYETLWKVPTLTKIQDVRYYKSLTTIDLKGEIHNNDIELTFNKKITFANNK